MRTKLVSGIMMLMSLLSLTSAEIIYWNDGQSHVVNNSAYSTIRLDEDVANNPGTHVELTSDAEVDGFLMAYHNSTVNMTGGTVGWYIYAYDDSDIMVSGGSTGLGILAYNNSTVARIGGQSGIAAFDHSVVAVSGGQGSISANDDSQVTFYGGTAGNLSARDNSIIYLVGTHFTVDSHVLSSGDKLSDYAVLAPDGNSFAGTITGQLADGSQLNSSFRVYNSGLYEADTAEIIIIPEPATLLLLGLGALVVRKRK